MCLVEREMARTKQTARRKTEDEGGAAAGPKPTPTKVWVEADSVEKGRKRAKVEKAGAEKAEKGKKTEKAETVEKK